MFVEKLNVKVDACHGIDAGLGDLILLLGGERLGLFLLRTERCGQWRCGYQAQNNGSESAQDGIPPAILFKHKQGTAVSDWRSRQ